MSKKLKQSAGISIFWNDKILLVKPTGSNDLNCMTPPKGGLLKSESLEDAAIRETWEEIGIKIDKSQISNSKNPISFIYTNKKGEVYKKCSIFLVKIKNLSEIGIDSEIIPSSFLQLEEIEWAGFLSKEESQDLISFRFKPLLLL